MEKRLHSLLAILALSGAAFASNYSSWSSYRTVTVNTSTLALTGNVTKIPLLVRLTAASQADMLNPGTILPNGADIRVTKNDGTTDLPFEIVSATTGASGAVELWVLADTVLQNSANAYTFRVYWGKAGATTASNSAAVFAPSNGFLAVWHFNQASGTPVVDATGAGHLATPSTSAPTDTTGAIGTGKRFVSSSTQFFSVSDSTSSLNLNTDNGPYTITAWANPATCTTTRLALLGKYSSSTATAGLKQFAVQTSPTAGFWRFANDPTSLSGVTTNNEYTSDLACTANQWQYLAGTYSLTGTPTADATATGSLNLSGYLNANAAVAGAAASTSIAAGTGAAFFIGKLVSNDRYMNGLVDEITISNVVRPADWLKLSYQTQQAAATAVTVGSTTTQSQTAPGAPTSVVGSAGNAQVSLTWTAPASDGNSPITSYTATSSPGSLTCTSNTGSPITPGCTVAGLTNGTTYTFTVVATNAIGPGTASSPSAGVTPAATPLPPTVPTGVTATAGNTTATVSWTASTANNSAITGYIVTSTPGGKTCSTTGAVTCVDSALTNGTAYTFTVVATSAAGNSTASAASNSVTPSTVPGAPTIGTVTSGNAQVTVNWTAPTSDGGSAITSYTATAVSDTSKHCTATGAATLTCNVTSLTNGTAYTFTVKATNTNGSSVASAASASVTPATVPGAPTITTVVGASGQVTVTWTAPTSTGGSPITSYIATATQDTSKHCTLTVLTGTLSCAVTGLTNTTSYTFTVVAVNVMGKGTLSATSSAVTGILPYSAQNGLELQVIGSSVVFHLPEGLSNARVSVMNLRGREVWSKPVSSGARQMTWDGKTSTGSNASGVYLVRLLQGSHNPKTLSESKVTLSP